MVSLIHNLDDTKWAEVNSSDRGEGFVEFAINRTTTPLDPHTLRISVADNAGNFKNVIINNTRDNSNPLKNVNQAELKLDEEGNVVGIDVEGDCVVTKG